MGEDKCCGKGLGDEHDDDDDDDALQITPPPLIASDLTSTFGYKDIVFIYRTYVEVKY